VLHSCREVASSGKLRKVLEVVLTFGNFMNQGRRGNAFGFKLSSLNNILDTKSSADREVTLLHYIIRTLESKVNE
jgi:dishevelled associated activator of morphogenesis